MKHLNKKEASIISGASDIGTFNPMIEYFDPFIEPFFGERDLFFDTNKPISTLPCTACYACACSACSACSACK